MPPPRPTPPRELGPASAHARRLHAARARLRPDPRSPPPPPAAGAAAALLILLAPLAGLLYYFVSEAAGIQVLIFASMAGARVVDVEAEARAMLPKFYCSDLHPESWRVFSACGRRCVLTANPRVMVEAFFKEYIGADVVMGTELVIWRGRATGLVRTPGLLVGEKKADALRMSFGDVAPEVGLGDRRTDYPFIVQGGIRGVPDAEAEARAAGGPAEAGGLPRRPARPEAIAGARAAHRDLDPADAHGHLQRWQEQPRGGQLHPAAHRLHAVLRVHQLHKDKYKALAGNDGTVVSKPNIDDKKLVMGC